MPEEPFSNPIFDLTEVRPSAISGLGVFATAPIPRGTVWWRARPSDVVHFRRKPFEVLKASARSPRTDAVIEAVLEFGYYVADGDTLFLLTDNSRYTNHSYRPNSAVGPDPGGLSSVAVRDIPAGEEIVEDYTRYDKCPWANLYGEFGRLNGLWAAPHDGTAGGR